MKHFILGIALLLAPVMVTGQSLAPDSINFSTADSIATAKYKKKYKKDIGILSNYLTQTLETDLEKARVIYRWIANNLSLEVEETEAEEHNSLAFLKSKTGSSFNFAMLFKEMCDSAGLHVVTVLGYSKGAVGYELGDKFLTITSAWNAILIDSNWYLIHPARGTGYLSRKDTKTLDYSFERKFNPEYFLADPVTFSMRDLAILPQWQLLSCPVSMDLFEGNPIKMAKHHLTHHDIKKDTCYHFADTIAAQGNKFVLDPVATHEFNPSNIHIKAIFTQNLSETLLKSYLPTKTTEELKALQGNELDQRKKQNGFLIEALDSASSHFKTYLAQESEQYKEWLIGSKERKSKLKIEHTLLSKDNMREVQGASRLIDKLQSQKDAYQKEKDELEKTLEKTIAEESLASVPSNPRENNETRLNMIERNQERMQIGLDSVAEYQTRMLASENTIKQIIQQINSNIDKILSNAKYKKEKLALQSNLERGETGLSHQLLHIYEIKNANAENDSLRKINSQLAIDANREKIEFNKLFNMANGKLKFAQNLLKTNKKLDYDGTKHDQKHEEIANIKREIYKRKIHHLTMLIDLTQQEANALNTEYESLSQEAEMHLAAIDTEESEFNLINEKKEKYLEKLKTDIGATLDQNASTSSALKKEKVQLDRL